jgi:signal transduction histidine kinase
LGPTFAISGLLLSVGLGGAWYAQRVNRAISESLDQNLAWAQTAERLVFELRDLEIGLTRYLDTNDRAYLEAAESSFRNIGRSLDELRFKEPAVQPSVAKLGKEFDRFMARWGRIKPADDAHAANVADLVDSLNSDLLAPAEELLLQRERALLTSNRDNQTVADRMGVGLFLLGACGAAAGLLAGYGIARGVHHSLVQLRVPVRNMAGKLNEVVGPITVSSDADLSELDGALRTLAKKTAEVVRRLQESQQQSLRREQLAAVGQLAAGLAHELRNPLMSMKLLVQSAAEREPVDSRLAQDLSVLEQEISRLEEMLQTFLDFASPPRPRIEPLGLDDLIEGTLQVVRPRANRQQVTLHSQSSHPDITLQADASQIRQLLLNLLLNALDALPGGGNIWVTVQTVTPPRFRGGQARNGSGQGDCVLIKVSDDGPGLPAEETQRIFEPFVSTKETGIGLGLAISQRIAEAHGGQITGRNRAEGGAEFSVQLPLAGLSYEDDRVPRLFTGEVPAAEEAHAAPAMPVASSGLPAARPRAK